MAQNFYQFGDNITVLAPAGGVTSGLPHIINNLKGVALSTAAEGENFELGTTGVYTLPKLGTDDIAQGAAVYWDAAAGNITLTSTGNIGFGIAAYAAGAETEAINVKLGATF